LALSNVEDKPTTGSKLDAMIAEVQAADDAADADTKAAIDEAKARDAEAFDGPTPIRAVGYDAKGESVDVDVKRAEVADEPPKKAGRGKKAETPAEPIVARGNQAAMPGFEGVVADEAVVNLSGRLVLNLNNADHNRLWNALRQEATVFVSIEGVMFDGYVAGYGGKSTLDKDRAVKNRAAVKSVKIMDAQ
jgi:hypothetical protein